VHRLLQVGGRIRLSVSFASMVLLLHRCRWDVWNIIPLGQYATSISLLDFRYTARYLSYRAFSQRQETQLGSTADHFGSSAPRLPFRADGISPGAETLDPHASAQPLMTVKCHAGIMLPSSRSLS
jgi:hypothetical protein